MTTKSITQYLDWDSRLLNLKIAKIIPSLLTSTELKHCLDKLRREQIKLVYWAIDSNNRKAIEAAQNNHGHLVDHKLTYCQPLNFNSSLLDFSALGVEFYGENYPNEELIRLAYNSGQYSRFRQDPYLTQIQFEAIYREWMVNSVNKSIAKDVLIIKQDQQIVGMTTVGEKNGRGDIGLLAVAENARGKRIGTRLVQAVLLYFIHHGYASSQVVTQKANLPACRLYEKNGYTVEKMEYFYHFWL